MTATLDARINAEAIVKAACIKAAADLIVGGKILLPTGSGSRSTIDYAVAHVAMQIWGHLEHPENWPA